MTDMQLQAVSGVTPPQMGEAKIREAWPSVARNPAVANLGRLLARSIVLAPLGWLMMSLSYFSKLLPVVGRRYILTNRRLMIAGWTGKPVQEIPLAGIDDVHVQTDANSDFFRAATLEIVSGGQVKMRLPGTPEADSFRVAILNARKAWAPREADRKAFIPASATSAS